MLSQALKFIKNLLKLLTDLTQSSVHMVIVNRSKTTQKGGFYNKEPTRVSRISRNKTKQLRYPRRGNASQCGDRKRKLSFKRSQRKRKL